ncbi:TPA: PD-(D/E)XK nuclease-like domain-containing protein [Salmonella enterica subsp. enterica serovar 28:e,h:z6]|nr:PD-(D/E)XK nuclease-like domain-containing protein [Salmonella enterica subsp. enterica serovar 28:e,h:z6]
MSVKQEEYSYVIPVKNESARKRLGFNNGFFWCTDKKTSLALSRLAIAIDNAGFDEADFKKPVRINFPVENDIPPEGVFDTKFCINRELGGPDGKTLMLIPGAASVIKSSDQTGTADDIDTTTGEAPEDHTENFGNDDNAETPDNLPAYAYNVNGELMEDVEKEMLQPVAGMNERHRLLSQFLLEDKFSHRVTPELYAEISRLDLDQSNNYIQDMLLACHNVPGIQKLDTRNLWKFTDAFKRIFPQNKRHTLHLMMNFAQAFVDTDYIDRGLLVKEWLKGNRVSCINRTPSGANAGGGILTDRGEGFVHDKASLSRDVATGVLARSMDVDIYNLHPAHAKRVDEIIAENKPPFSVFLDKLTAMPGGMDYSRAIVVASVKEAPIGIEAIPARVTEYLNRVLTETDHANPDPLIVDIACGRTSQPMPMTGSANDDEEKPQPTGVLADEPAAPETVEQNTTESHPDTQPLDDEPQVNPVDAAYQKIRAELHEARANIPPKNPVDVGKQLAAARGEYVEGISDPNDPKWIHESYRTTSNDGEKQEVETPSYMLVQETDGDKNQADETLPSDESDLETGKEADPVNSDSADAIAYAMAVQTQLTRPAPEGEFIPAADGRYYFEPGRYEGIPNDVYHSANGISSTMVKDARISLMYYHGRHVTRVIPRQDSQAFILGRITHSFVLEPEKFAAEYAVPAEMPKSVVSTTSDMVALIKEYNATLPALMTPDELKAWIERYNSSLIPPLSLSGNADETANLYMSLPAEFQRIPEGTKPTASAMKACIKEYNASLPPVLKTSGTRDQLLDQISTVGPEFAEQERAKFIPYNISGTKEQLAEIVRAICPDVVFADDWHKQQEAANAGKEMISNEMYGLIKNINDALQANKDASRLLNHPARQSEVSYFGLDEETGLEVRVRPDIEIRLPYESICADLKTVSLGYVRQDKLKDRLHREIIDRDYHLSAAMYCDIAGLDKFTWIFVNKDPGYHWVVVVDASPMLLELGRKEYRRALRQIEEAMETGYWPAPITETYTDELNDYDTRRLEALGAE